MQINSKIFKAYDIRGIYPEEINEETAYKIGRAFVDFTKAEKVIVGRDARVSGPSLHKNLVKGIIEQGADVLDIGLASTDMFYFACGDKVLPGVTVTASHNPSEYNGFKMVKKMPDLISGDDFREFVLRGDLEEPKKSGSISNLDIKREYADKVRSLAQIDKIPSGLKIVVDAANGMGGVAFDLVYKNIPVNAVKLFFEPDGTFPNHGGDPLKSENRKDLEEMVKSEKADLGFAFDTDADRFFAVDKNGEYVPSDYLGALFSKYFIEKNNSGKIVHDAIIGWAVRDFAKEAGGENIVSRVGHVFIKKEMEKRGALFGIEKSGHYYLPDFYFAESAVGVSLLLLEMLGHWGKSLDELVRPLREKYFMIEQTNIEVNDPDATLESVKDYYKQTCEIKEIDGVSIVSEKWHANLRKSNTEPVVRLNIEALEDRGLLKEKQKELMNIIKK